MHPDVRKLYDLAVEAECDIPALVKFISTNHHQSLNWIWHSIPNPEWLMMLSKGLVDEDARMMVASHLNTLDYGLPFRIEVLDVVEDVEAPDGVEDDVEDADDLLGSFLALHRAAFELPCYSHLSHDIFITQVCMNIRKVITTDRIAQGLDGE